MAKKSIYAYNTGYIDPFVVLGNMKKSNKKIGRLIVEHYKKIVAEGKQFGSFPSTTKIAKEYKIHGDTFRSKLWFRIKDVEGSPINEKCFVLNTGDVEMIGDVIEFFGKMDKLDEERRKMAKFVIEYLLKQSADKAKEARKSKSAAEITDDE